MKIARIGTGYIVTVWILVVLMLGSVLYSGYKRNRTDLVQLMMNEAERLVEVVGVSARAGIHALDEVEYITVGRLLENARLIEHMSRDRIVSPDSLTTIARANNLHMINILDADGGSLSRSETPEDTPGMWGKVHRPEVDTVLRGDSIEEIFGFGDDQYYSGKRYGVAVGRLNGGAVVVNTDSDEMLEFRKSVGLGTLFGELGGREGIRYIVLQDTLGIVAASGGVTEMSRIGDDPFLMKASRGESGGRITQSGGEGILEVAYPLIVDDVHLGLLRIGLSTGAIDIISKRAVRHFMLLFAAAMISGVFLIIYVMLRQNYMILDAEHDRILGEVRRMEEETRRSERLASMGRLAAGVAHEIRNPLNAISIIAQRLKLEFTPTVDEEEYGRYLSTVGSEISRISTIIEQFLKYARPPKLTLTNSSADEIIGDVLDVVGEKARVEKITISLEAESGLKCHCDVGQMKQALLNVMLNAIDAAGHGGSIAIGAWKDAHSNVFRISDSGSGIPEDVLQRIFDPYFTTKENGNGLGLSEVHRIVTAHNGRVGVANGKSGGAVVTITIPYDRRK